MKTNLGQVARNYIIASTGLTITGEIISIAGYVSDWWSEPDLLTPLAVGIGLPALVVGFNGLARLRDSTTTVRRNGPPAGSYGRNIPLFANGRQGSIMASTVAWVVGNKATVGHTWGDRGNQRPIRYREPRPEPEFRFYEPGMPSVVGELRLLKFCQMAWRRQQQALLGTTLSANQIFSRPYFTTEARPRFPTALYQSIIYILVSRDLIINRWQGKGGELVYPPGMTLEQAKIRWSPTLH